MANSTFLHVLVIGAASNRSSWGQVPASQSIKLFQLLHPEYVVYFYFIDPDHRNMLDFLFFHSLMDDGVPLCVVAKAFDPTKLSSEYKIFPDDKVLIVDYAGIADTESAWKSLVKGDNISFYIAHTMESPVLDMVRAYETAHAGMYSISSDCPIPKGISKTHKIALINELRTLINYTRLLPTHSASPPPPDWLVKKDAHVRDASLDDLFLLRATSETTLESFFAHNGIDMYSLKDAQWFAAGKQLIDGALARPITPG